MPLDEEGLLDLRMHMRLQCVAAHLLGEAMCMHLRLQVQVFHTERHTERPLSRAVLRLGIGLGRALQPLARLKRRTLGQLPHSMTSCFAVIMPEPPREERVVVVVRRAGAAQPCSQQADGATLRLPPVGGVARPRQAAANVSGLGAGRLEPSTFAVVRDVPWLQ